MNWIILSAFYFLNPVQAAKKDPSSNVIVCDSVQAQPVQIGNSQIVVLDFILPPKEVIPSKNVFLIKAIKSDVVVRPQMSGARSLFVVYLENKRCLLELFSTNSKSKDVYLIRDPRDSVQEVGLHGL